MNPRRAERVRAFADIDLYPVTSAEFTPAHSTLDIVDAVIQAGCKIFQLREKSLGKRAYFELAREARRRSPAVLMICNDHLDVALAVGADGVHLGTDDLPLSAARALAPELLLGASTHGLAEAREAQMLGADYVNIGPIFPTTTKEKLSRFLGPQAVSEIAPQISIPFTVMGGINLDNLDAILRAGARRIALVTAVTRAPDPARAARALRERILGYPAGHSS